VGGGKWELARGCGGGAREYAGEGEWAGGGCANGCKRDGNVHVCIWRANVWKGRRVEEGGMCVEGVEKRKTRQRGGGGGHRWFGNLLSHLYTVYPPPPAKV
jgi:hypothetical protein